MSDLQDKLEKELKIANDNLYDVECRNKVLKPVPKFDPKYVGISDNNMCTHCGRVGHFRDTRPALIHAQFRNTFGIAKNVKKEEEPKAKVKGNNQDWYLDSGCSRHITGEKENFLSLTAFQGGSVSFENKKKGQITHIGNIGKSLSHAIEDVYYVENDSDHEEQEEEKTTLTADQTNEATPTEPAPLDHSLGESSLGIQIRPWKHQSSHPLENNISNPNAGVQTRNKLDEQGNITRNKARLVIHGYNQDEGIDYDETFAPVARREAIRMLIAFDAHMEVTLYQMDVKSAFLNGYLKEEVFVKQPPEFESEEFPDYVFKLDKALCGLKQAPRAWYERLSKFLLANNFIRGKTAKVKATSRIFVKIMHEAATQGDTVVKESVIQGESGIGTTDQIPHPISKLDVLASAIDVAPLDTLPPTSDRSLVEKFTVEERIGDLGNEVDTTAVEPVVEWEGRKEPVQKEASDGFDFSWTKDEEDDKGEKEEEVVTRHEEHDAQNIANEEEKKEENQSEEEEVSESEGEDQENISESEGGDDESKEEEGNVSEESEGSMTIGNTVIAPLEEIGEETMAQEPGYMLTPFTGDEEVSSDEDDMPLSEVDEEDESDSALPAKSATPKKKGDKVTKHATSSAKASRGKTRKNVPAAVDRLTEFRNRKVLNWKILANTGEKGMAQLVEKHELQGWNHIFVKAFPPVCVPAVVEFYTNFTFDGKLVKSKVGGFDMEFDAEELGAASEYPFFGI
nr:uncharacterized protein LOC117278653 [Nicotiana tomentosiformis]